MRRPTAAVRHLPGAVALLLALLLARDVFAGRRAPEVPVTFLEASVRGGESVWGGCRVASVSDEDRPLVRDEVERALLAYPPGFVQANAAGGVAIAARIETEGVEIGGTNWSGSGMLLVGAGSAPAKDPVRAEHSLHHELFHLLFANQRDRFPMEEWLALNPPGFRYLERPGVDVLRVGAVDGVSPEAARRMGFAHPYGLSNPEEDAAMIAETLMANDRAVLDDLASCPVLAAKCRLLARFYASLDRDCHPPAGWDARSVAEP